MNHTGHPTRRQVLASLLATAPAWAVDRPKGPIVETHVHLFSADTKRFPFAPDSPYKAEPLPVEEYVRFAVSAGIDRAVIVSPEPYQDDYRYLEYCFTKEPSPGFFKGICLLDPTARILPTASLPLSGSIPAASPGCAFTKCISPALLR